MIFREHIWGGFGIFKTVRFALLEIFGSVSKNYNVQSLMITLY